MHLGRAVRDEEAGRVVDDVYWSSPWLRNPRAGRHLDTRVRYRLEPGIVEPRSLVQLVTAKEHGRATAYSRPRRLPGALPGPALHPDDVPELEMSTALSALHATTSLSAPRMVGVLSAREAFTRPASVDDLLGSLVQAAVPIVQQLLAPAAAGSPAPTGGAGATAAPAGGDQLATLLATLLRSLLGSATGALATTSSVRSRNRLTEHARPMLFGVDDALLAALAGPVLSSIAGPLVQALPELLNSANQHRLDSRREDYRMIAEIMQGLDRGQLIDRLASAAPAPGATGAPPTAGGADLAALLQLLHTATAPAAGGAAPVAAGGTPAPAPPTEPAPGAGPAPVRTSSLTPGPSPDAAASAALLAQVAGPSVPWLGSPRLVFVRDQALVLRFRLDPGPGGPTTPLPRAILTLVVREPGGRDVLTREERLTAVAPGQELRVEPEPGRALVDPGRHRGRALRPPALAGGVGSPPGHLRPARRLRRRSPRGRGRHPCRRTGAAGGHGEVPSLLDQGLVLPRTHGRRPPVGRRPDAALLRAADRSGVGERPHGVAAEADGPPQVGSGPRRPAG